MRAVHRKVNSWRVTQESTGAGVAFLLSRTEHGESFDIAQTVVREAFLAIRNHHDSLAFFEKFGPFSGRTEASDHKQTENSECTFATIESYQEDFRKFIETPSPECFQANPDAPLAEKIHQTMFHAGPLPIFTVRLGHVRVNTFKQPSPFLEQVSYDVVSAIYASIYIDKMAGALGGLCQRCEKPFLIHSDRPASFCSKKCGNAARQARKRWLKKQEESEKNG